MSKFKVCIVTTAFPRSRTDNRAPFILEAAKALNKNGCQVQIIAMHRPGSLSHETWDDLEIIRPKYLPERFEILQEEEGGLPVVWEKFPLARFAIVPFLIAQSIAVAKYARQSDVIHANWTLSGFLAVITRAIHRRKIVVTVQGSDIYKAAAKSWGKLITKWTLNHVDKIIALSESLALATQKIGVGRQKITIIPNGVDINVFNPGQSKRAKIILFVGSLIERKGVIHLINAYRLIQKRHPDSQLIIIGDGPDRAKLTKRASEMGLSENISFLGSQTQSEVKLWMQKAKVFVLPSLEEGLGVVLLEALACGTPCVGSNVGGIPDVITPDVGQLVPPQDENCLATEILKILDSEDEWSKLSSQARFRAETHYSWDSIAKRIQKTYEEIQ